MKYLLLIFTITIANINITQAASLYAPDGTYLGEYNNNKYDPNSISNPYGQYGSKYSTNSINNPYGPYGSKYSTQSPNNPYQLSQPVPNAFNRNRR